MWLSPGFNLLFCLPSQSCLKLALGEIVPGDLTSSLKQLLSLPRVQRNRSYSHTFISLPRSGSGKLSQRLLLIHIQPNCLVYRVTVVTAIPLSGYLSLAVVSYLSLLLSL